jgi:hypothetical protein
MRIGIATFEHSATRGYSHNQLLRGNIDANRYFDIPI